MSASHHRRIPPTETQDLQGHPWVNRVPRIAWWQKNSLRPTCERSQNNLIAIIRNNLISLHLTLTYTHSSNTPAYESINTEKRSDFDLRDMIRLKKKREMNKMKQNGVLFSLQLKRWMLKILFQYHFRRQRNRGRVQISGLRGSMWDCSLHVL